MTHTNHVVTFSKLHS